MSTITLPNIRVSSDLTVGLKLKDGGVAIDWSTLSNIKVSIYADAQRSLAGRCTVVIDEDDSTVLVCQYAANKPQYLGVNRVIVQCTYMGETKTYDKPAFTFVRWTDDLDGEEITITDPDIDVEISVEDVSSSILQEAVDAAFTAAERADEAAAAAEHMVDIHTGPEGKSAYQVAVDNGYVGTEDEWLASLEGPQGEQGIQGETGEAAGFGAITATVDGTTGTPAVTVQSSGPDTAKSFQLQFSGLKGEKGDQGIQGNTGSSVDYPFELVNNETTDDATKAHTAAGAKRLKDEVSQLELKVDDLEDAVMETSSGYEELTLTLLNGYYQASDGVFVSASDKRCAEIVVTEGEKYKITSHLRAAVIALIVEWNGNGQYVGYVKKGTGVDENVVDYEYTVPAGVAKIGISNGDYGYAIGLHAKKLVTQSVSKVYTKEETNALLDGYYTKEEIDETETITTTETEELAPTSATQGYVAVVQTIGQSVSLDTRAGFGNILSFPSILAGSVVTVNFSSSTGHYGFALCDESDKVLEYCDNNGLESYTFEEQAVNTRLYASSNKFTSASVERVVTESVKEAVIQLKQEVNPQSERWEGKTILWFGTSIPAGSDSTIPGAGETIAGNYPTEVGNDLQATVINKAVGGSMCRANVRTGDYVGANFANITSALTMTKAEIESFITNYATIKGVLTGGAPETLSADQITRLRSASFEDRLIPYLDGTYDMPDLFVFDHGHNDFKYTLSGGGSDIGLEPTVANIGGELAEDTFMTANNNEKLESFFGSLANIPVAKKAEFVASVNRNCFIGSVNFLVTLILHYNPHARILFISNYEYENGVSPSYAPLIPAQDSIAKSWAFPICRVYEYLGFSSHIIPGSMAWFNTTYTAQTPATTDITVYKAYLPDGVHPHSDITGDANNIYAGIISEFIKKIY